MDEKGDVDDSHAVSMISKIKEFMFRRETVAIIHYLFFGLLLVVLAYLFYLIPMMKNCDVKFWCEQLKSVSPDQRWQITFEGKQLANVCKELGYDYEFKLPEGWENKINQSARYEYRLDCNPDNQCCQEKPSFILQSR